METGDSVYPGVELRLLRYVAVLAQELNFTRASVKLRVAQPSLSKQIRELEQYLGIRLFDRNKREVRLTAAGEAFAVEARQSIFHAERAVEGARTAKNHHKGPWSIAYSPLVDLRVLSKIRQHLFVAHPAAEVKLLSAHTSEQSHGLMRGVLQAGLVSEPGLTCEGVYRQALLLALPEGHPLVVKDAIEITDLHEIPLVTIRADIEPRFGEDLNRIFAVARVRPHITHQVTTQAEVLELIGESSFIAGLTLPSARHPAPEGIVFRRFVDEFLTVEMGLAYLPDNGSPILGSLRKFLIDTFQPLSPCPADVERRTRQMKMF